ncbi:capsule biosynthesis protein [Paracoccus fontiphilus]|uniref:Capsule biosynthesis protein n=1 Tax=Paracoccus fontiphilus TaxID=1815556 RepID=A0ABV7IID6_9RHOB|nr:capsule biosynthesis protein [Paracoccus fontiphilus]
MTRTATIPPVAPVSAMPASPVQGTPSEGTARIRPAGPARSRQRHWVVLVSFLVMVVLPSMLVGWYLWTQATDRYVSSMGFSIRTEEAESAVEFLGGITGLSGSSSSDTDVLYNFLKSSEIVAKIDTDLDLRTIWSQGDPLFSYHPPGTIEDLTDYWQRMVGVYYDTATGILELQVQAFDPEDAHKITSRIFQESSALINRLSAIAREDATAYAREELHTAVERLKVAREAVTRFRNRTQIVDPAASIQSQMGILSSLQEQLAQTLIDLDILRQITSESDPRIQQAERRIDVIQGRIAEERAKLGIGSTTGDGEEGGVFADLVGEYERLMVDQQFAEQTYTAAMAAYDAAVAEARRQTRYLAAHVQPTLAERPTRPYRVELTALTALFSFMIWGVIVLMAYALRDRR